MSQSGSSAKPLCKGIVQRILKEYLGQVARMLREQLQNVAWSSLALRLNGWRPNKKRDLQYQLWFQMLVCQNLVCQKIGFCIILPPKPSKTFEVWPPFFWSEELDPVSPSGNIIILQAFRHIISTPKHPSRQKPWRKMEAEHVFCLFNGNVLASSSFNLPSFSTWLLVWWLRYSGPLDPQTVLKAVGDSARLQVWKLRSFYCRSFLNFVPNEWPVNHGYVVYI